MTKEEYAKALQKYYNYNKLKKVDRYGDYGEGYTDGLAEALDYAIGLAEKLDEPEKVVIPQFVADWIEDAKLYSGNEVDPLGIIYWMDDCIGSKEPHYEWLKNIDNQKLLLNAIANGYEVEKEPRYRVQIKGFEGTINYLNYDVYSKEFFVDTTGLGSGIKIKFTKSWLKDHWSEYDAYNNAGLLEFEEVEDD